MTRSSLYTCVHEGMKLPMPARRSQTKSQRCEERELSHWRLIERFQRVLDEVLTGHEPHRSEQDKRRLLSARSYFSLFLFGLFNPVLTSMRGLCEASQLERVRAEVCTGHAVSLGSFSEAQEIFDPQILAAVHARLAADWPREVKLPHSIGQLDVNALRIVDSTLWHVVTRMGWAQWREQYKTQRAVRLHVKLRLADGLPVGALSSAGVLCERKALRAQIEPGEFYLGDRNYGCDYALLADLSQAGCGYLLRLREQHTTIAQTVQEHELSEQERALGVVRDALVRLGWREKTEIVRLIIIQRPDMVEPVWLVTNQTREALSAGEASELYRRRWEVEGFFRWLKCLLPCRHWLAESQRGVAIQMYCALICALLLAEQTGRMASKRMLEMLRWQQMGMASEADLHAALQREQARAQRREAARAKRAAQKTKA